MKIVKRENCDLGMFHGARFSKRIYIEHLPKGWLNHKLY